MSIAQLRKDLKQYWNPEKADFLQKFFKSNGKETKEIFRGITVPNSRLIAKKYHSLELEDVKELLHSQIHEERLIALFILVFQYQKSDQVQKKQIVDFFLENKFYINDWDLVDTSAHKILGDFLKDKPKELLITLAHSDNWWERRIAIIATFQFIIDLRESEWTFKIAEILLKDKHDLIHKAVGWMLREVGKRISPEVEEQFLQKHFKVMPRTMLRYSIEHFNEQKRQFYLKKD